jgi:tyrosine-protein kinase Etk/Wzc
MPHHTIYTEEPSERLGNPLPPAPTIDLHQDTMLEFLIQIAERKWLIAKITGVSIAIGLVLCFVLPVRYTAVTRIMPPKQSPSMAALMVSQVGLGALSQAAGANLLSDPNGIYIGMLKSRTIADQIILKFQLQSVYDSKDLTDARDKLKEFTAIQSDPSTMISISVTDRDRKRAADIANYYTDQLRALSRSLSNTEASRRRAFFEEQTGIQKEALVQAEAAFQQVQQNKGLVHLDTQAGMIIGNAAQLRGQIAAKQVQLQALRSYSTENNPDLQIAEHELAGMREQLRQMEDQNQSSGYADLSLKDVSKAGMDYLRAQRQVQFQQAFFDVLQRQFEAAKLDEAREAAIIQVVEPAVEPERKSSPKRGVILLASAFIGLFVGCLTALILRRFELEKMDPEGSVSLQRLKSALLVRPAKSL